MPVYPRISLASDLVLLVATCEQPPLVACPCHKITARVISAPTSLGRQSKQKDIVVRGGVGGKHKRQRWLGIEKREPTKKCHINATHCEDELNHHQQQQYPIRMTHRTVLSAGAKSSLAGGMGHAATGYNAGGVMSVQKHKSYSQRKTFNGIRCPLICVQASLKLRVVEEDNPK